jgi:hypothetical protein
MCVCVVEDFIRYRSNRGVSFSFRRVLFRLSPAATQTRGRGIPLYRPAGLWHPVGDPSHVLWDVAAPSDNPGELRNIQKTRFGGGSRGRRRAYRRVSTSFGRLRAFDGPKNFISAPNIGTFGSGASIL